MTLFTMELWEQHFYDMIVTVGAMLVLIVAIQMDVMKKKDTMVALRN